MNPVEVVQGRFPVILAFPHTGTWMPDAIHERLNDNGILLADTDWHVHTLYGLEVAPHLSRVRANFHRYVIDANRDPSGASLYPGQNTTGLVPVTDFDGKPIWQAGREPTAEDVAARLAAFHAPYHAALRAEIGRVKALHGIALVYDCHSIRSRIPFLFDGTLPDFNIGTHDSQSCAAEIERVIAGTAANAAGYTSVLNGRFKGGWTTRHYGKPKEGVQALQMELAQSTYLVSESPPFAFDAAKAERLREPLRCFVENIDAVARHLVLRERRR